MAQRLTRKLLGGMISANGLPALAGLPAVTVMTVVLFMIS